MRWEFWFRPHLFGCRRIEFVSETVTATSKALFINCDDTEAFYESDESEKIKNAG
jgi:hypothetical protein